MMTNQRPLIIWLSLCAVLVFSMVVVGGMTRLTESGLSIVQWKLVTGTLPPLSEESWQAELGHYRQSPEYQQINKGMSLQEFKGIFWLEYIHRLLGRLVGLACLLPLLYFAARKKLSRRLGVRMGGVCLLVGLQGIVGWYMVKSGLVDEPRVSAWRLSFHLGLAFIIFEVILWSLLEELKLSRLFSLPERKLLQILAPWLLLVIFFQVLLGALVAGQDAGFIYNTFPLMDGQFVPSGLFPYSPWVRNLGEDVTSIQFLHRMGAYTVVFLCLGYGLFMLKTAANSSLKYIGWALMAAVIIQFGLGVTTLIYIVPIPLASLHQTCAVILFGIATLLCYGMRASRQGTAAR